MRFCTTHRACESDEGYCEVIKYLLLVEGDDAGVCTLVDALIIEKVDGGFTDEQIEMFEDLVRDYHVASYNKGRGVE